MLPDISSLLGGSYYHFLVQPYAILYFGVICIANILMLFCMCAGFTMGNMRRKCGYHPHFIHLQLNHQSRHGRTVSAAWIASLRLSVTSKTWQRCSLYHFYSEVYFDVGAIHKKTLCENLFRPTLTSTSIVSDNYGQLVSMHCLWSYALSQCS